MSIKTVIRLNAISFSYQTGGRNEHQVLSNLNLEVYSGDIVGLIGRNATGKTTLLNIIRGAIIPDKGEIYINNKKIVEKNRLIRNPEVSLITQRPIQGLAPAMTVYENYLLSVLNNKIRLSWAYTKNRRLKCQNDVERADINLTYKLNEQVRFLSEGQQQALSLLLALNKKSNILLLDEPTASLDVLSAKKILDLIKTGISENKGAAILVSHRIRDILNYCNRIVLLHDGYLALDKYIDDPVVNENILINFYKKGDSESNL